MNKQITDSMLDILENHCDFDDGNIVRIGKQLDRKEYVQVNQMFEALGGKWNKKAKGHVFSENPKVLVDNAVSTGGFSFEKPTKYGFFPTPSKLAKEVVARTDIKAGMLVLEPSAGLGAIAFEAGSVVGVDNVHCVELQEKNVILLRKTFKNVIQGDFMGVPVNPIYDRVVMNPPFEKQADIDHVIRAYSFLKAGGVLTAILSAGTSFRTNRKAEDFRTWIKTLGSKIEDLPEGSFKESGTMTNTVIVTLKKPS